MQLNPGTMLHSGSYRVIEMLGCGGFGITYLAEQVMARRKVCIKEFFPKGYFMRDKGVNSISILSDVHGKSMARFKEKFIKEAQTIASLDHPNIIHIIDVFEENNTAYYVMEYVDGGSLGDVVKQRCVLSEELALKYIRDIASALRYIHVQSISHLDIKPSNIMVRARDDSAVLIDFGLSKHYDEAGDQTSSTPVGISHGYAPIEQYKVGGVSSFSPTTDIYSLGATLYYLVTAKVPPQATDVGEYGIPPLPQSLSMGTCRAIEQAMGYWRKDRPASVDMFLSLLDDSSGDVVALVESDDPREAIVEVDNAETLLVVDETKTEVADRATELPEKPVRSRSKSGNATFWILFIVSLVIFAIFLSSR